MAVRQLDLDRRPIPEQIADGLTRLVLSGELPSGQPLAEASIATDLGVSRNTVREAVRLLERSGLVRYESNRGAVVREPTHASLTDVYHARLAIELGALSTTRLAAADLAAIDASLSRLAVSLAGGDQHAVMIADLDFHEALVTLAGSPRLSQAYTAVLNELKLYLTTISRSSDEPALLRTITDHQAITEALQDRNQPLLAELLRDHITSESHGMAGILQIHDDRPA